MRSSGGEAMKKHDKDRSEQTPLLYISQPDLKTPTAPMQQSFIIKSRNLEPTATKRQEDKAESVLSDKETVQQAEQPIFTEETEVVIASAAAAVLEVVDSEKAVLETNSIEELETVLQTVSEGDEKAVLETNSIEELETVLQTVSEGDEKAALETNSVEELETVLQTVSEGDEEAALEPDSVEKGEDVPDSVVFQEQENKPASIIRKSFHDMNIEEKLSYLLHRPHYIPKIMCEVETKTRTYVGYIISFDNNVVILRTHTEFFMTKISYQDIIDIQMRAF
jgi:hypothetical protein